MGLDLTAQGESSQSSYLYHDNGFRRPPTRSDFGIGTVPPNCVQGGTRFDIPKFSSLYGFDIPRFDRPGTMIRLTCLLERRRVDSQ